jgi:hypothetical protein
MGIETDPCIWEVSGCKQPLESDKKKKNSDLTHSANLIFNLPSEKQEKKTDTKRLNINLPE